MILACIQICTCVFIGKSSVTRSEGNTSTIVPARPPLLLPPSHKSSPISIFCLCSQPLALSIFFLLASLLFSSHIFLSILGSGDWRAPVLATACGARRAASPVFMHEARDAVSQAARGTVTWLESRDEWMACERCLGRGCRPWFGGAGNAGLICIIV
jgi:hypothetical protein